MLDNIFALTREIHEEFLLQEFNCKCPLDFVFLMQENIFTDITTEYVDACLLYANIFHTLKPDSDFEVIIHDYYESNITQRRINIKINNKNSILYEHLHEFIKIVKDRIQITMDLKIEEVIQVLWQSKHIKFGAIVRSNGSCYIMFNGIDAEPASDTEIIYIENICSLVL